MITARKGVMIFLALALFLAGAEFAREKSLVGTLIPTQPLWVPKDLGYNCINYTVDGVDVWRCSVMVFHPTHNTSTVDYCFSQQVSPSGRFVHLDPVACALSARDFVSVRLRIALWNHCVEAKRAVKHNAFMLLGSTLYTGVWVCSRLEEYVYKAALFLAESVVQALEAWTVWLLWLASFFLRGRPATFGIAASFLVLYCYAWEVSMVKLALMVLSAPIIVVYNRWRFIVWSVVKAAVFLVRRKTKQVAVVSYEMAVAGWNYADLPATPPKDSIVALLDKQENHLGYATYVELVNQKKGLLTVAHVWDGATYVYSFKTGKTLSVDDFACELDARPLDTIIMVPKIASAPSVLGVKSVPMTVSDFVAQNVKTMFLWDTEKKAWMSRRAKFSGFDWEVGCFTVLSATYPGCSGLPYFNGGKVEGVHMGCNMRLNVNYARPILSIPGLTRHPFVLETPTGEPGAARTVYNVEVEDGAEISWGGKTAKIKSSPTGFRMTSWADIADQEDEEERPRAFNARHAILEASKPVRRKPKTTRVAVKARQIGTKRWAPLNRSEAKKPRREPQSNPTPMEVEVAPQVPLWFPTWVPHSTRVVSGPLELIPEEPTPPPAEPVATIIPEDTLVVPEEPFVAVKPKKPGHSKRQRAKAKTSVLPLEEAIPSLKGKLSETPPKEATPSLKGKEVVEESAPQIPTVKSTESVSKPAAVASGEFDYRRAYFSQVRLMRKENPKNRVWVEPTESCPLGKAYTISKDGKATEVPTNAGENNASKYFVAMNKGASPRLNAVKRVSPPVTKQATIEVQFGDLPPVELSVEEQLKRANAEISRLKQRGPTRGGQRRPRHSQKAASTSSTGQSAQPKNPPPVSPSAGGRKSRPQAHGNDRTKPEWLSSKVAAAILQLKRQNSGGPSSGQLPKKEV
jgi:hypothetical protein